VKTHLKPFANFPLQRLFYFITMANRVLRDWTASESVDSLSEGAEVFFTRLIMKADDYGSFHANPKLLKAALFPLKELKDTQILKWITECVNAKVLFVYAADGRQYLRIVNFGQRLRNMRSTFPQPDDNSQQVAADCSKSRPETETKRNETESETETNAIADETPLVSVWPSFDDFWNLYDKKDDRPKCEKKYKSIKQEAREKIMEHLELYVRSTPDKKFRKNPLTYLNNESWENEIIIPQNGKSITRQGTLDRLNSYSD
jgi:hypothetical protein